LSSRRRAWHKQGEFEEVSPIERQIGNLAVLDYGAQHRRILPQRGLWRGDYQFLIDGADFKRDVQPQFLIDLQRSDPRVLFITCLLNFDSVGPWRQRRDCEFTLVAGSCDPPFIGFSLNEPYRDIR